MISVGEIVALRDAMLSPSADAVAAHRALGPAGEASADWKVACLTDGTPFKDAQVEMCQERFAGVCTRLRVPIVTTWLELRSAFGESELMAPALDDWAGPFPYRFRWPASDQRVRGHMILLVAQPDPKRESPPDEAKIVGFIIRRATGVTQPGRPGKEHPHE